MFISLERMLPALPMSDSHSISISKSSFQWVNIKHSISALLKVFIFLYVCYFLIFRSSISWRIEVMLCWHILDFDWFLIVDIFFAGMVCPTQCSRRRREYGTARMENGRTYIFIALGLPLHPMLSSSADRRLAPTSDKPPTACHLTNLMCSHWGAFPIIL